MATAPKPNCPACSVPLEIVPLGPLATQTCKGCGGVWLGAGLMEPYLRQLDKEGLVPEAPPIKIHAPKTTATAHESGRDCPQCRSKMEPFNYGYDSNIFLDRCASCEGMWADKGELIQAAQHLRGRGTAS